jgi:hypothetical protein
MCTRTKKKRKKGKKILVSWWLLVSIAAANERIVSSTSRKRGWDFLIIGYWGAGLDSFSSSEGSSGIRVISPAIHLYVFIFLLV